MFEHAVGVVVVPVLVRVVVQDMMVDPVVGQNSVSARGLGSTLLRRHLLRTLRLSLME